MKIIVRNTFHKNSTTLRVGGDLRVSREQVSRARSKLCGISNCKCSGPLGERGDSEYSSIVDFRNYPMWFIGDENGGHLEYINM